MIPVTSTRYNIDALKLPSVTPWRPWYDDGQVKASSSYRGYSFEHFFFVILLVFSFMSSSSFCRLEDGLRCIKASHL